MLFRLTVILFMMMTITGCGSSQYEENFKSSLTRLNNEAPFSSLWPQPISIPLSIEGENIILQMRVPRIFDTKTNEAYALDQDTPEPRNRKVRLHADRLWPKFLQFGTHLRTYEVTLSFKKRDNKNTRSSIRCFISVMPRSKEVDTHGVLSKRITEKLKEVFNKNNAISSQQEKNNRELQFKSGVGEWTALSVPMPNGNKRQIEKIRAIGNIQLPSYMQRGKPATQNKTFLSSCLIYIVRSGQETVILSWLLPVDLAAIKNIDASAIDVPVTEMPVARAMAGTVKALTVPDESNKKTN